MQISAQQSFEVNFEHVDKTVFGTFTIPNGEGPLGDFTPFFMPLKLVKKKKALVKLELFVLSRGLLDPT